jgi:hypothetical protein
MPFALCTSWKSKHNFDGQDGIHTPGFPKPKNIESFNWMEPLHQVAFFFQFSFCQTLLRPTRY